MLENERLVAARRYGGAVSAIADGTSIARGTGAPVLEITALGGGLPTGARHMPWRRAYTHGMIDIERRFIDGLSRTVARQQAPRLYAREWAALRRAPV